MVIQKMTLFADALTQVVAGKKTLIIVLSDDTETPLKVGDIIVFETDLRKSIKAVRMYLNLAIMMDNEDPEHIYPGCTKTQVLKKLRGHYTNEDIGRILVYEIEPLLRLVPKAPKKTT